MYAGLRDLIAHKPRREMPATERRRAPAVGAGPAQNHGLTGPAHLTRRAPDITGQVAGRSRPGSGTARRISHTRGWEGQRPWWPQEARATPGAGNRATHGSPGSTPVRAGAPRQAASRAGFTGGDWALLAGVAVTWGASFLFIKIGVEGLGPGLVAVLRLAFGAVALALLPAARRVVLRSAWPPIALLGVTWMGHPVRAVPPRRAADWLVAGWHAQPRGPAVHRRIAALVWCRARARPAAGPGGRVRRRRGDLLAVAAPTPTPPPPGSAWCWRPPGCTAWRSTWPPPVKRATGGCR